MEDLSRLCFSCMGRVDAAGVCPNCGENHAVVQETPFLPLGGILAERYYIGEKKRRNSEGYTYIAFDIQEGRRCSVREFFPEELAVREADGFSVNVTAGSANAYGDAITEFRELWETLLHLRGLTSLISVYDVFDENGTSYAVYAETELYTLRDYLLEQHGGYVPWEEARILFMPVLSTLGTLHASGIVHKGIDPTAFLVTGDGRLKLSGFSGTEAKICYGDLEPDVSDGYAPLEIYTQMSEIGPWTDIYSFTAVLYRALIGATPIASPVRAENDQMMIPAKFAERLPPFVINAIINGMQIFPEDRTRNTEQLRANLSASPTVVGDSANIYRLPGDLEPEPPRGAPVYASEAEFRRYAPDEAIRSARETYDEYAAEEAEQLSYEDRMAQRRAMRGSLSLQDSLGPTEEELQEEETKKAKTRRTVLIVLCVIAVLIGLIVVGRSVLKKITGGNETTTSLENMNVPSLVGMTYDQVMADQTMSTFFKIVKVEEYNASVPVGQIINQSLTAGTPVKKGAELVLYVSAGAQTVVIPDVANKTYEEASATLTALGVVCTQASKYNDGTHPAGVVVETMPAAGSTVAVGDTVTVVVWGALVSETTTVAPSTTLAPTTVTVAPSYTYTVPVFTDPVTQPVTQPVVTDPTTDPQTDPTDDGRTGYEDDDEG